MPFVAFDLQGTLCTFEKVIEAIEKILKKHISSISTREARFFFKYWYNNALRDYIATCQAGRYCSLSKVLKMTLPRELLCELDIVPGDAEIQKIMRAFDNVDPATDAIKALELLAMEGNWDIWVLSMDEFEDTVALLERIGMTIYTKDNILCCDDLRISKPHPKVYSELIRMAVHRTQRIENFYMVGSYAFDLAGAKNVSLRTVFLDTNERVYSSQMYSGREPDVTGSSLMECVSKMIDFEKTRKHFVQPILENCQAIHLFDNII